MRQYRAPKMVLEKAGGNRICQFCDDPIKKRQECYTLRVRNSVGYFRGIHIHKWHMKRINEKTCKHRMECVTETRACSSQLCSRRKETPFE